MKGKISLLTGGDAERRDRLSRLGIPDDRIRVPMLRGHDGKMHEVSWEAALDRAAWLFLHAREWVSPEAVAIYGNGQKTMEVPAADRRSQLAALSGQRGRGARAELRQRSQLHPERIR